MTKPSDFYIGVVEFFGVLLPGAAITYLLQPFLVENIPTFWLPTSSTKGWVMFIVLAYIAGHLLHGLGSELLDKYVYDKFYIRYCKKDHYKVSATIKNEAKKNELDLEKEVEASKTLLALIYLNETANSQGTNYYDWCLSDVRVHVPAGASEVDRIQADSKFFRSMFFVFLIAGIICGLNDQFDLLFGTIAFAFFALWRFCKLRWTATKRVYEYYLLSRGRIRRSPQT